MARFRAPNITKKWEELRDAVWDLYRVYRTSTTSETGDYTTNADVGREFIFADSTATGTQTITLHTGAKDLQERIVKKSGSHGGAVSTATEGSETIDGSATHTVTDVTTYLWTDEKGEWSKI